MLNRLLRLRQPLSILLSHRKCSSTTSPNEYANLAKSFIKHVEQIRDTNVPHYFQLDQLRKQVSELHEEYSELSSIDPNDELAEMANEECAILTNQMKDLLQKSMRLLSSMQKYDSQNAYLEVTAGAGGTEAGVFAAEIFNLYLGYVQHLGFNASIEEKEIIKAQESLPETPIARVKASICGFNVFSALKYECGVHRVQRVPYTGTKSDRMQTSTCSVAVVPQPNDEDIVLHDKDLKIEAIKASGPGGQNVNKNPTCARILHLPTGIIIKCMVERTFEYNKKIGLANLKEMLYSKQFEAEMSKVAQARQGQVGNMDRNEKIRSYNFNRNAISEHRLGEVKQVPDLSGFLRGAYGYDILDNFKQQLEERNVLETLKELLSTHNDK